MESRSQVELPSHVEGPLEVFVNGVLQQPGVDYEQRGRTLVFGKELAPLPGFNGMRNCPDASVRSSSMKSPPTIEMVAPLRGWPS